MRSFFITLPFLLLEIAAFGAIIYVVILLIKALRKYLNTGSNSQETRAIRKSLGEVIKEHRTCRNMTQEFVAERLGVSRQAVSKWESGASDPSTSNLLALAKLFGVPAEDLLKSIQTD